jgi:sugar/nucleoside kinase (ribokinase family)
MIVLKPSNGRWDVVGVGANAVDLVNVVSEYPQPQGPSSKIRVGRRLLSCGGQTANAMATCASFGLRSAYVGATGSDEHGLFLRETLAARGVDVTHVITREATNQFAVIILDETTGERVILWDRDARLLLRDDEIPTEAIKCARLLHVDDVDERAAITAAAVARGAGVLVTSDIDAVGSRTSDLIGAVDVPIFDEHLPCRLTGTTGPEHALRDLRRRYGSLLCATLGPRGAIALDGDRLHRSPGFAVKAVDTTGAGDVFRGGFIYALLQGWPIDRVLEFANAAAAISCTRIGAMTGIPSLDEVNAMMRGGERNT